MPLPGVSLGYRAYRLPRQGHGLEECQDALAADAERGRFAIADGAAESPYSSLWARLLVEEFVRQSERLPAWSWVEKVSETFSESVPDTFSNGVPWYLEEGLRQGAFATFLGLVIEERKWYAVAVGDSCLFQVRRGELIRSFPLMRAVDFGNAPWLVGSRTSPIEVAHKNGLQQMGECQPGDCLWLMTDALAQWFLAQVESGEKPWQALAQASSQQTFAAWIEELRSARQLRNDDVALLAVSV
jgi:hypothetical protein